MNKDKIIRASNLVGLVAIILLIYWVFIFVSIQVFGLKVFRENITQTFYLSIIGILSLMAGTLMINIMFNLTRISEYIARSGSTMAVEKRKKWPLLIFILSFPLIFGLLFGGDFLTSHKKEAMIKKSAEYINQNYQQKLKMLTEYEFSKKYINQSYDFVHYLIKSTENIKDLEFIVHDKIDGEDIYLLFGNSYYDENETLGKKSSYLYKCSDEEKTYLNNVFINGKKETRFDKYNGFYEFYFPVTIDGKTVILYFSERQEYGKIGS